MTGPIARTIEDDELADWLYVPRTAMLGAPPDEETVERMRERVQLDRCVAAFDGSPDGRPVGSAGSFHAPVAVPGGRVDAGAVTAVGVLPTHRRQGHLSRMMQLQLADIAERDEPIAILVAAEYPIYGRFGYGPATDAAGVRIDTSAPDLWVDPPTGRIELVDDNVAFTKALVDVYARVWSTIPGHLEYEDWRWPVQTGEVEGTFGSSEERRSRTKVVWRDAAGEVGGVAAYTVKDEWQDNRPQGELRCEHLVTATAEAERELVRYMSEVDWTARVVLQLRPVDEPVALWLRDGRRAVIIDRSDHCWIRVLDVAAALTARRYAADGRLVLEIDDPMGFANGRYALEGGPDGALCTPTDDDPDLVLDVKALGSAYLGGHTWHRLAAGGWVSEARAGALERASTMFTSPRAPWCALTF
ncbi:MAG TPA: GNAT family N-acetyltransferase [Acidimicrobiales bacterium]